MDMFNVKRRDFPKTSKFTEIDKPPFGGPNETEKFDGNTRKSLDKYQRKIERDHKTEGQLTNPQTGEEMFQPNYDSAWNAITKDKVSRDAKIKPTNIMNAKSTFFTDKVNEEVQILTFDKFVNENFENEEEFQPEYMQNEEEDPNLENQMEEPLDIGYEVDEEQLESVIEEYGDDLNEVIDKIVEGLEIEKEEAIDLICAAIEKLCKSEEDDDEELQNTEDAELNNEDNLEMN